MRWQWLTATWSNYKSSAMRGHNENDNRREMEMKRTLWITGIVGLMAGLAMIAMNVRTQAQTLVATSSASAPVANDAQPAVAVKIDNFTFAPTPLTVEKGTTVRWTNHDDIPHNVVAEDKSFKSKTLDTDDVFTYTFTKPGTYKYFCGIHPKMTATVVVK
jgi:plastocyanin